jgi:hypothetical protein
MPVKTVVKASFAKGGRRVARSKAAIKYHVHRPGKDQGERPEGRQGFDAKGNLERGEMLERANHQGRYHYRLVLSPHPELSQQLSEQDLKHFTREVMEGVSEEWERNPTKPLSDWTAVIHQDPDHPHVHVMFYRETPMVEKDFDRMRDTGGDLAHSLASPWLEAQKDTLVLEAHPKGGPAQESEGEEATSRSRRKPVVGLELGR